MPVGPDVLKLDSSATKGDRQNVVVPERNLRVGIVEGLGTYQDFVRLWVECWESPSV